MASFGEMGAPHRGRQRGSTAAGQRGSMAARLAAGQHSSVAAGQRGSAAARQVAGQHGQHGSTAAGRRKRSSAAARQSGSAAAGKDGSTASGQHSSTAAGQRGSVATWQQAARNGEMGASYRGRRTSSTAASSGPAELCVILTLFPVSLRTGGSVFRCYWALCLSVCLCVGGLDRPRGFCRVCKSGPQSAIMAFLG